CNEIITLMGTDQMAHPTMQVPVNLEFCAMFDLEPEMVAKQVATRISSLFLRDLMASSVVITNAPTEMTRVASQVYSTVYADSWLLTLPLNKEKCIKRGLAPDTIGSILLTYLPSSSSALCVSASHILEETWSLHLFFPHFPLTVMTPSTVTLMSL